MNRRQFLQTSLAAGLPWALSAGGAPRSRPNFVFILADDLGWADVSYNGSVLYETPNIDRLAAKGVVFTNAYAANPLCSPTRASILTGQYPARLRITRAIIPRYYGQEPCTHKPATPEYRFREPIIRDGLPKETVTLAERLRDGGYASAHIGKWHLGPPENPPEDHGFELNIGGGHYAGPPSYFSPYRIHNLPDGPEGEYLADRLTDEAITFLENRDDKPFFLYLSHYSVHGPWQAKDRLVEKYRAKVKPKAAQKNPVYAAMVQSLDESVGRVLDALTRLGLEKDTVVVFFSDNGGLLNTTPGLHGAGPTGQITSNAPLRGGKSSIYEGGIRVPAIIYWPGVTTARTCADMIISNDFVPTLLGMAGLPAPGCDGLDLTRLLRDGLSPGRDTLYWHWPHGLYPCAVVREKQWKLIRYFDGRRELYDLDNDISEKRDLASERPILADRLSRKVEAWLKEVSACLPEPNQDYDPNYDPPRNGVAKQTIQGWTNSEYCSLTQGPQGLRIACRDIDPYIVGPATRIATPATVQVRMRSRAVGKGMLFWRDPSEPRFSEDRAATFAPVHDGAWRTYEVRMPRAADVLQLRLDPAIGPGDVDLSSIKVVNDIGQTICSWDFAPSSAAGSR